MHTSFFEKYVKLFPTKYCMGNSYIPGSYKNMKEHTYQHTERMKNKKDAGRHIFI